MRRFLSILLCLTLVFTFTISANAEEIKLNEPNQFDMEIIGPEHVKINEFDNMQKMAQKTAIELRELGYSEAAITEIYNYESTFRNHLYEIKSLDEETLAKLGYSSEQIQGIKAFDGDAATMDSLSATVTLYVSPMGSYFRVDETDGHTYGRVTYNWVWNGVPAAKNYDLVALQWNDWTVEDESSYVDYYRISNMSQYFTESAIYFPSGLSTAGTAHKFAMAKNDNTYYGKRGGGSFDIRSDDDTQKDFHCYAEYGHTTVNLNVNLSFSIISGGSDSITFNIETEEVANASAEYRF